MIIEQYAFKKLIGKMQAILAFPKLYFIKTSNVP